MIAAASSNLIDDLGAPLTAKKRKMPSIKKDGYYQ
jgi:hypothetical protein